MKRLITGREAMHAGLDRGFGYIERIVPAIERLPYRDAYQLWRSLPGYRKACRMLRRSGHRIPRNSDQRDGRALFDDAAVFGLSERRRTQ